MMDEQFHTVVIGGGQAGLAAGHFLARAGLDYVILEASNRTGDSWRKRWDSLRLFTPAKYDCLPGLRFPGHDFYFPTKDETADYLESYVDRMRLPVRLNTAIHSLTQSDGFYSVNAGTHHFIARNVIVATGAYQQPIVPSFAREIDPSIVQLHSSSYKRPDQVPEGPVLVVGAGNSGAEIAIELARTGHKVWLAGRDVGRIPASVVGRLFGGRPYWFFISRILSIDTPAGRKVRKQAMHRGTPLIRLKPEDITNAGVARCARVRGTFEGRPQLDDGTLMDVKGIVWATGFRPNFSWIKLPVFDELGFPFHKQGVLPQEPGLYFVGLHFQTALSSALLGGVGADAAHVVGHIQSRRNGHGVTVH